MEAVRVCVCARCVCCVYVRCVCVCDAAGRYNNIFGNILLCREVWYISRKSRSTEGRGCSRVRKGGAIGGVREVGGTKVAVGVGAVGKSAGGAATRLKLQAIHTVGFPPPSYLSPAPAQLYTFTCDPSIYTHKEQLDLNPMEIPPCSLPPPPLAGMLKLPATLDTQLVWGFFN